MKNMNPTRVTTGKDTRFSYLNVHEPKAVKDGDQPMFSASLIIPKTDVVTINKINKGIEAAYKEGEAKLKGNGKTVPPMNSLRFLPLHDGDQERPEDDAYRNSYFINAKARPDHKPKLFGPDGEEIVDSSDFYSGIYGKAIIQFYCYNHGGNKGIATSLLGLKKIRDGEPLGGATVTADDFDDDDFLD